MKYLSFLTLFFILSAATSLRAQDGPMRTSGETELLPGYFVEIQLFPDEAVIRMIGPADRWLGVGFNAIGMQAGTGTIFYAEGSQGVQAYDGHLIGNQAPVEDASQDLTVLTDETEGDSRIVEVSRPLDTGDSDDFVFDYEAETLQIIYAHGNEASLELAFHGNNRGSVILEFSEVLSASARPDLESETLLFPNPADETLNLRFSESVVPETIRIFDAQARVVKEIHTGRSGALISVSLSGLPGGVYFAEISTADDRAVKRFVKH